MGTARGWGPVGQNRRRRACLAQVSRLLAFFVRCAVGRALVEDLTADAAHAAVAVVHRVAMAAMPAFAKLLAGELVDGHPDAQY